MEAKKMNPVAIQIGNFEIKWYSIMLLIAVIVGVGLLLKEGKKFNYPKDFLFNMCFWALIFGFIGARIYYVLFNWGTYASDPVSIFKIWEGGLAIHGGLIAGFITILVYCRKYNVRLAKITDMAVPGIILAQAIGRWGNFFNGEAHGSVVLRSTLESFHIPEFIIEGMNINGVYYHPTFLYESLWCLLGFIILICIRHYKYLKVGGLTCFYLVWYSVGRFFIESMRTDSLMLGGFKVAQIISVVLFIIGILGLMIQSRKGKFEDLYHEANQTEIRY